jgi:uncharacterized NAD(P)/FAD-binding protein YdhS
MSKIVNIAIIGLGPRGLVVLERLSALLPKKNSGCRFIIHIFEENKLGEGVHTAMQPDYLLLNTICSQISMYADASVANVGIINQGETFAEWLIKQGIYQSLDPNAYLPRSVLGQYLADASQKIINNLRRFHSVRVYHDIATDIRQVTAQQYQIYIGTKIAVTADYIYLTTGHSTNMPNERDTFLLNIVQKYKQQNSKLEYLMNIYPIRDIPAKVSANYTVAIEGLGLAALDVLTALTVGKGGRYIVDNNELIYQKSGDEPTIIMYSLDGLPLSGRAYNQKDKNHHYHPKIFTYEKISLLRKLKGVGPMRQLDFELDVFPELIKEIYYCYYTTWLKNYKNQAIANQFGEDFIKACASKHQLINVVHQYIPKEAQLNWKTFFNPFADRNFNSIQDYKSWLIQFLEQDLAECHRGNLNSPYKAACDSIRDMRDVLRFAVEFSGLTPASHKIFFEQYMPFLNRISIGPPKERVAEMLALIKAGVLDIFIGPSPQVTFDDEIYKFTLSSTHIRKKNINRYADVIIKARIPAAVPAADQSPLMQNAIKRGLLTAYSNGNFNPGGIAINNNLHPIDHNQQVHKSIWAMGPLVEGAKFYTFVLPAPGNNSVVFRDANTAVLEMLSTITPTLKFSKHNNKNKLSNNKINYLLR